MRSEPGDPDGEVDPLDAALGELQDLAELERRFAMLDERIGRRADADDDPFSDLEAVLREQRAMLDRAGDDHDDEDDDSSDADEDSLLALGESSLDEEEAAVAAEIEQRCQDALDALEADDPSLAREIAMAAVRMDDEHPFPLFVLGLVAEREDDLDTARDMAELALRTATTNPDAIGLRAHIHVRQHEFEDAEQLLRFGIAHNPDEAPLHEALARVALARGRHDEALAAAASALRIEPGNPGALAVRAAALEAGADRGALLAALRQGVQLHPEDPYSMVELASVEMEHGNVERARMLLMRAQRLAPRDPDIGDVRALVEHVNDRPLLRPVPGLLRWMRDFPGGLPGFLVGFVVTALPLHALATTHPEYRVSALSVIVAWGAVALYAWIAPAALTHRLNQRAALGGLTRLEEELRDPCTSLPDVERLADVVSMLATAHLRADAVSLLRLYARRADAQGAGRRSTDAVDRTRDLVEPLTTLAGQLDRPSIRLRFRLVGVPGLSRALVAAALAIAITVPALVATTAWDVTDWYVVAAGCLAAASFLTRTERRIVRAVDAALIALRIGA